MRQAHATLVMEIAEQFEYDDAGLRRARVETGRVPPAGCPGERESLPDAAKMKSLVEALA